MPEAFAAVRDSGTMVVLEAARGVAQGAVLSLMRLATFRRRRSWADQHGLRDLALFSSCVGRRQYQRQPGAVLHRLPTQPRRCAWW
ncbi:hypothetical protein [Falsiroseomonas stagni]|uniref:hypothetical protein n=1 Tax=Falsiroseomonas stagni TaxID=484882 RepID=UPI000B86E9D6|nr:hypothetical protein [Falsiroseomonas stagni]